MKHSYSTFADHFMALLLALFTFATPASASEVSLQGRPQI